MSSKKGSSFTLMMKTNLSLENPSLKYFKVACVTNTILVFFLFALVTVISIILLFMKKPPSENVEERELFQYRSLFVDQNTNEKEYGIVTLTEPLGDEGFKFTELGDDRYHLISDFDEECERKEYVCTGYCYVEEEEEDDDDWSTERRVSGTTTSPAFSRTLTFLVSAFSSVLAYKQAENYFKEKCAVEMAGTFKFRPALKGKVDDCKEDTSSKQFELQDGDKGIKYLCSGRCFLHESAMWFYEHDITYFLSEINIETDPDEKQDYIKKLNEKRLDINFLEKKEKECANLVLTTEVTVPSKTAKRPGNLARDKFGNIVLEQFCNNQGGAISSEDRDTFFSGQGTPVHWCTHLDGKTTKMSCRNTEND